MTKKAYAFLGYKSIKPLVYSEKIPDTKGALYPIVLFQK